MINYSSLISRESKNPFPKIRGSYNLATSYSRRGKPPTTIGAEELNFRVRDGNGCDLFAIVTRLFEGLFASKLNKTDIVTRIRVIKPFLNLVKSSID